MKRGLKVTACVAALVGAAACGGSGSPGASDAGDPFVAALRGTWWACESTAPRSRYVAVTITGPATGTELSFAQVVNEYPNPACAGAPDSIRAAGAGSLHVGPGALADLEGARVTARRIDLSGSFEEIPGISFAPHDLAYVRTDSTPARLYAGLKQYGLDGSTPEARPVELWTMSWLVRD